MSTDDRTDAEKIGEFSKHVFDQLAGALTSAMICVGDQLGLYRTINAVGPCNSQELSSQTGLSERWLREWLYQQGASGIVRYDSEGRFFLSPEAVAVLADEDHPAFGAGHIAEIRSTMSVLDKLPEAFKTGMGLTYDAFGDEGARGVERGFAPWYRTNLLPVVMPALKGVKERLESGGRVADIGCGAGVALILLSKAYPKASLHGYDISEFALKRAERNRQDAGVDNVFFHNASADPITNGEKFDLVLTLDCLHDMTQPGEVMKEIRKVIAPDGTWLIADIKARATFEDNVAKNPMASLMYGFSVMHCMSSSLSEPNGLGLGTLGFHEKLAREMTLAAGFRYFDCLEIDHPINAFYVIRP